MASRHRPQEIEKTPKPSKEELDPAAAHVKELAEADYATLVLAAELPVVLQLYAADSKPCEELAQRLAAVAKTFQGKVNFLKVSQTVAPELAAKLGITASPTLVFFKAGAEKGARLTGAEIKRTEVKASVEALLA
jgi:thioredoxin-like negative regulator of GroEL